MKTPPLDPPVSDSAPSDSILTAYDKQHLATYLRLDAEAEGADRRRSRTHRASHRSGAGAGPAQFQALVENHVSALLAMMGVGRRLPLAGTGCRHYSRIFRRWRFGVRFVPSAWAATIRMGCAIAAAPSASAYLDWPMADGKCARSPPPGLSLAASPLAIRRGGFLERDS